MLGLGWVDRGKRRQEKKNEDPSDRPSHHTSHTNRVPHYFSTTQKQSSALNDWLNRPSVCRLHFFSSCSLCLTILLFLSHFRFSSFPFTTLITKPTNQPTHPATPSTNTHTNMPEVKKNPTTVVEDDLDDDFLDGNKPSSTTSLTCTSLRKEGGGELISGTGCNSHKYHVALILTIVSPCL